MTKPSPKRPLAQAIADQAFNLGSRAILNMFPAGRALERAAGPKALPTVARQIPAAAKEAALQVDTVMRGAATSLTGGRANKFSAAMNSAPVVLRAPSVAVTNAVFGMDPIEAFRAIPAEYRSNLADEDERDRYDAEHRSTAQDIGTGLGIGIGLASPVTRGLKYLRGGASLTKARPLAQGASGTTRIALGGGLLAGLGAEHLSSAMSGEQRSWKDYAAAGAGGLVGGGATLMAGGDVGGAAEGLTTTALNNLLNGRRTTPEELAQAAATGAIWGKAGAKAGTATSASLPRRAKGKLGEAMSRTNTLALGQAPTRHEVKVKVRGGHTRADHGSSNGSVVEAKFGYGANLSKRQRQAKKELTEDQYRIDHWLPDDIGNSLAVVTSNAGTQLSLSEIERERQRQALYDYVRATRTDK